MTASSAAGSPAVASQSPGDDNLVEPPVKRRRETNGSGSAVISNRRKAACQSCRLRKVKCDRVRPRCAVCKTSGAECEYLDVTTEKLSLEAATSSILERLDQLQKGVDSLKDAVRTKDQDAHRPPRRTWNLTSSIHHSNSHDASAIEPSRDFLQIPPHKTSSDTVLNWEIFEDKYPRNALISVLFEPDSSTFSDPTKLPNSPATDAFIPSTGLTPPDDERIPVLIDNFLQNVHTKNPILDVESLVKQGRKCAEQGVGWDAWSCLVLLACALGSVARPFDTAAPLPPVVRPESIDIARAPPPSSARMFAKELQQAESCFILACRRLGLLKHTMLGAQCHFFAGVYLMYTLRPILSWQYFLHASILYQLYLKTAHGILGRHSDIFDIPSQHLNAMDQKVRRLEQSLYWSCFKSECEFRVELPLPQSEIGTWEYPALFPSPPSPIPVDHPSEPAISGPLGHPSTGSGDMLLSSLTRFDTSSPLSDEEQELRQHAKRLCNEEESWYYYLTEIALRRIGNRIINTFFRRDRISWLNIRPLLRIAQEFEAQVSSWSAHLPPAMLHYETTSIIRAPHLNTLNEGTGNYVSRELSWATDNRLLEMQTWLYQPFLYYLIHVGGLTPPSSSDFTYNEGTNESHRSPHSHINSLLNPYPSSLSQTMQPVGVTTRSEAATSPLDADDISVLRSLITSGIECNLKTIDVRSLRHRHHGLWYDLRSTMCASLILLAIVKSGNTAWIPGGTEILWGPSSPAPKHVGATAAIGGRIGKVIEHFEFWAAESPDLLRHKEVLEAVLRDIRGS